MPDHGIRVRPDLRAGRGEFGQRAVTCAVDAAAPEGASVPALGASIQNTFTAIDSRTNKIAWQQLSDGEQGYGALTTAGGLVFKGQADGNLVALDAKSGAELWRFQTGLGISAPPMTWSDGTTQYVTVAVGGNRGQQIVSVSAAGASAPAANRCRCRCRS